MAKTNRRKSEAKPAAKPAAGKNTKPVKAQGKQTASPKPTTGKVKRLSEFRYPKKKPGDKRIVHPAFIFRKEGKVFVFFEITHDKGGANNSKTKKLEKNPNPSDTQKAKIKKKADKKPEKDFGERLKGWKFQTAKDTLTVNELIKQYNQSSKKT